MVEVGRDVFKDCGFGGFGVWGFVVVMIEIVSKKVVLSL
jgi:hypothetical protein